LLEAGVGLDRTADNVLYVRLVLLVFGRARGGRPVHGMHACMEVG
jgi:hypothetical protein